jgi:hypothetical protein
MSGMSHAMQKLKAKWEAEWREKYAAEHAAIAQASEDAHAAQMEAERGELLPIVLIKIYQRKVREERQYRLRGNIVSADLTLRQLTHLELYMEFAGLTEPEIMQFFDQAQSDPHPWETETSQGIAAHRQAAWAMDLPDAARMDGERLNTASAEPVEPQATAGQLREDIAPPSSAPHH